MDKRFLKSFICLLHRVTNFSIKRKINLLWIKLFLSFHKLNKSHFSSKPHNHFFLLKLLIQVFLPNSQIFSLRTTKSCFSPKPKITFFYKTIKLPFCQTRKIIFSIKTAKYFIRQNQIHIISCQIRKMLFCQI